MAVDTKSTSVVAGSGGSAPLPMSEVTIESCKSTDDKDFKERRYWCPEYVQVRPEYTVSDRGKTYKTTMRAVLWEDADGELYAIGTAPPNLQSPGDILDYQFKANQLPDGSFEFSELNKSEFKRTSSLDLVVVWVCQVGRGRNTALPQIDGDGWRALRNRGALLFDPAQLNNGTENVRMPGGSLIENPEQLYWDALSRARSYLKTWNSDIVRILETSESRIAPEVVRLKRPERKMSTYNPLPTETAPVAQNANKTETKTKDEVSDDSKK